MACSKRRKYWINRKIFRTWPVSYTHLVGDTKVKIAIEEDEEPWDDIPEEVTEETEKEIEENIDPNYIKEEK